MTSSRSRWATVVALIAGGTLMCALLQALAGALAGPPTTGPERFAHARVVVRGDATLRVPTEHGTRTTALPEPRPLPPALLTELRALGPVVEDRSFAVRTASGAANLTGHPWSTAPLGGYRLTAGRAPQAPDEVAASGSWPAPGTTLRTGQGTLHVVGTVAPPHRSFENALFFTDARAAQLVSATRQVAVDADPTAVRRAVSATAPGATGPTVLTGGAKRAADPDAAADRTALTGVEVVLGTAAGVTGFVVVFAVSSVTALAVAARRREFGLLRLAGATAGRLRRRVLTEQLLLAIPAAAAGCALGGAYGASALARWMVNGGLAPAWFAADGRGHVWPYPTAMATEVAAALCGSAAASWRAGRTAPAEALREADTQVRALTRGRALAGGALLAAALGLAAYSLFADPADLLHRKSYVSRPMLLVAAAAALSPALVRPLLRLLGARGRLVRAQAAAAARRTAAVAAPVVAMVALAGALPGAVATVNAAKSAEIARATTADLVLTAAGGLDTAELARVRRTPGVRTASAATALSVTTLEDGVALIRAQGWAVDPATLPDTVRLPVVAGRLADLDDGSIVVNAEWQRHTVGESVTVWLADGTPRRLRIAAVLAEGTGDNGVYLTPRNAPPGAAPALVRIRLAPGASPAAVTAALRRAVPGADLLTGPAWVRSTAPHATAATRLGLALTLGIALLYATLALATAQAMSTAARTRELTLLRHSGATRLQLLRLTAAESLLPVAVGATLGLLTAALDLATLHAALTRLAAPHPLTLPWPELALTTAVCAAAATAATTVPVLLHLTRNRARP
ncbi:FtsX-like permease family protein [Streptomyces sp. NRRL F-5123]|uniref:FtsX-like permease family protein n=1 Tax=Streptomyces sp. NRRL F-5123 TaxID=1463856 RepID=UPI0004E25005|nr:FtsX-like permease family protein [Streptomyces sp. NRRL F-5123]